MSFLKRYPVPIAGLILALFALGNLSQLYGLDADVRLALGAVGLVLWIIFLLKLLALNAKMFKSLLDEPVPASVLPTFTMATMLLGGYVKPFHAPLGEAIWWAGLAGHVLLILWFTWAFVMRGFAIKKVFPSWFIVWVGLAVASISAPVVGRLDIGEAAFWFAFVTYVCLLPFVCRRMWIIGEVPPPARPTAAIFAAPASLLLAGYMTAFSEKMPIMIHLLTGLSLLFYAVGFLYMLRHVFGPFMPSWSAFTFPMVISAIATTAASRGAADILTWGEGWLPQLARAQAIVAGVVTIWVLIRYLAFLATAPAPQGTAQSAPQISTIEDKGEKRMEAIVTYRAEAVSPKAVQKKAEELFAGGFFCCEALMSAIRSEFQVDVPESVIAMSSAMSVGAGRSGCMCGALNGGILALGMFFGRTTQDGPKDPKVNALLALSKELHDWFRDANAKNAICCRVLTKGFDMAEGQHRKQCIAFTGLCAGKLAEILCRELGVRNLDAEPIKGLEKPFLPPEMAAATA